MNPSIGSRGACALLLAAALLAGSEAFAAAVLQSASSSFGPDTIPFDAASGERWLDLTESTSISHTQILVEVAAGGLFEGYHLATNAEIAQLFADAGIDLGPGTNDFVPQNYDAIVALTNGIGVLGTNGSCGTGCTFSYRALASGASALAALAAALSARRRALRSQRRRTRQVLACPR